MTIALLTLTFLLAAQTVAKWYWRRKARQAVKLNLELLETNAELMKVTEGARLVAKIAARGMRENEECEWPEFIEGKGI